MRPSAVNPTPQPPADATVWDDLSSVLDELDELASRPLEASEFYGALLGKVAPMLAAERGAVWLRSGEGALRVAAHTSGWAEAVDDRRAHETLLAAIIAAGEVASMAPGQSFAGATNHSADHLLVAPVSLASWTFANGGVVSAIELALPAGRAPSSYAGAEQLLRAVADVAAEYHVRRELSRLSAERTERDSLIDFAEQVGGACDLHHTAQRIASEGARIAKCDRMSVLTATRRGARLFAVSGTDRVERRSRAARALERLAVLSIRSDEPIYYCEGEGLADTAPQVADVVNCYVDEFHARQLVVIPIPIPAGASGTSAKRGVLVAEQFAGERRAIDRSFLTDVAQAAAPAIASAIDWHELPLGGLLRTLGWLRTPRTLLRLLAVGVVLATVATVLLTIPAQLSVDVRGQLVPLERQDVFAPRSAIVDQLSVQHADKVNDGQTLIVLRDPDLSVEIERLRGEQTRLNRQLEAVRATRSTAAGDKRDPLDVYRLSAEEEELRTQLSNLDDQLELLQIELQSLEVASPLDGTVTTWQLDQRLAVGRPVERGQVLLSLADTSAEWKLELAVPDEKLDLLRSADNSELKVEYRLGSDASLMHTATVTRIAERVEVATTPAGEEVRQVIVEAQLDNQPAETLRAAALRPGGSVRARIVVGDRPLGYVLTSDLWRAIRNWWEF